MKQIATSGARPRVGIDLHILDGKYQGSRTHCIELFSRAIQLAPEIDFIAFLDDPQSLLSERPEFALDNCKVVRMPHHNSVRRLLVDLPALSRKHHIDLLHSQYIVPPFNPCATAVTIHDILFEHYPQYFSKLFTFRSRLLVRSSAHRAAAVFTVSEFCRADLEATYGIALEEIVTLHNAADLSRYFPGTAGAMDVAELGVTPGEYLLTVGRLEPRKNHLALIDALASLPIPRPKLLIVGQRDFGYQAIFERIKQHGLGKDVIVRESISDHILPAVYRNARMFVYPTWAEGFGMPVIEAMASGVPVITSRTTSLPEVAGDCALYIEPASSSSIAEAVHELLVNQSVNRSLQVRGPEQARKFKWEHSASTLVQTYRRLFGSFDDESLGKFEQRSSMP